MIVRLTYLELLRGQSLRIAINFRGACQKPLQVLTHTHMDDGSCLWGEFVFSRIWLTFSGLLLSVVVVAACGFTCAKFKNYQVVKGLGEKLASGEHSVVIFTLGLGNCDVCLPEKKTMDLALSPMFRRFNLANNEHFLQPSGT